MSKPMVVTLPFVLLLIDFWPLERFQLSALRAQRSTLLLLVREKLPFFFLTFAASLVTYLVQSSAESSFASNLARRFLIISTFFVSSKIVL